jgi:hypothetical protein
MWGQPPRLSTERSEAAGQQSHGSNVVEWCFQRRVEEPRTRASALVVAISRNDKVLQERSQE